MLSLLTAALLATTAFSAPISVVRRQDGLSKSFKDLKKPILAPFYVYFGNKDTKTLSQAFDDLGMRAATIGFGSAPEGKCELVADLDPLEKSNNIKDFIAKGGAVSLSFGGNLNDKSILARQHLQQACKNEDDLAKLITDTMNRFGTHNIDFDIEDNGLLSDDGATERLAKALAKVKKDVPDTFVTYTMSTGATGMGGEQIKQLDAAKKAGLDLDGVLLMTMNMLPSGSDNVKASRDAISGGAKQVSDALGISLDDATKKMGMVPSIGVDNNGNVIDLNGAKDLAGFAKENGMVIQSYWNFNRDFPGGDPKKAQDLTVSSSPDQKDAGDFFKTMNDVLNGGDAPIAAAPSVADIADSVAPVAADIQVQQKESLPAVGADSVAKAGAPGGVADAGAPGGADLVAGGAVDGAVAGAVADAAAGADTSAVAGAVADTAAGAVADATAGTDAGAAAGLAADPVAV